MRGVFISYVLTLTLCSGVKSWAQTHVFHCEVNADVPKLEHLKIKTTPIEIEAQIIGKNIYPRFSIRPDAVDKTTQPVRLR